MASVDRTFTISERALELMRSYCECASPQSYELWFTFVTGLRPFLNEAVKEHVKRGERLTDEHIRALYQTHLASDRLATEAERTGANLIGEIDQVVDLISTAVGSTARYDASLKQITADLDDAAEQKGLRDVLESLVAATREVATTNRTLEDRLKDSRTEIESLRETLEHVRSESLLDPLTGIANRKHFEESLISAASAARTSGAPLALVVIDIDHFKRFNDLYGHLTGDQVLKLVSMSMRETLGTRATLARFGGEEFAMILPGADRDQARCCAEEVRRSVEGRELLKRSTGESLGRITVSLGVAMLNEGESATSLLERADQCMYAAKRAGRNRTITDADPLAAAVLDAA